jgi:hypothetical protein
MLVWWLLTINTFAATTAPKFDSFAKALTDKGSTERVFDIWGVSGKNSLKANIEGLFYPQSDGKWGVIWDLLKYVWMLLVFIYIVYSAIILITSMGKPDKIKSALTNLLYVLLWSFLFFWSIYIFTKLFNIQGLTWTENASEQLTWTYGINWGGGLLLFILSLLKWAAFFIAIVYIVLIWFQLMNPSTWESWDGKKIIKKLGNVIFALIGIKVVDFLYYIASTDTFATSAGNFIVQVAKFLAYIAGIVMVIMIIYSWYLLIVDGWKGENFKKAKNTLINILLAVIALFFFLFILYQIFAEFWGNT